MIAQPKLAERLTLVPNQRIYDLHLGRAFQLAGDRPVVAAPALEVLSRWVEQVSVRIDLLRGRPVAGSADRLWLAQTWQQAVLARPEWTSVFESQTLARSARAAERLMRQWCPADMRPASNPDFLRWREAVSAVLREQRLFTPEDWLSHLRSQLEQPGDLPLRLPLEIRLHGFPELTRLEQSLLDALRGRGTGVVGEGGQAGSEAPRAAEVLPAAVRVLHCFDSAAEEARAAAQWAMRCLQQGGRRIAIVVNGLDALAGQLTPVFDRIFHPRDGARIAFDGDSLYHLADGSRLSEHAVVDDALLILRMSLKGKNTRHPFPDISRLLLSPHLAGWRDERMARARFEARLRGQGRYLRSLRELEELLDHRQLPALSGLLSQTGPVSREVALAEALLNRLRDWGWPGSLASGGLAAARVHQFTRLLESLRRINPGSAPQALATLSAWCGDTRITERGGTLSPVQLINPQEAVGQRFDAAWVINIHDGNWPAHPATNPFLRQDVLKWVPRATPEGELRYTRKLHHSLDRLAPEVHYSWSRSGDAVPRLASPLLGTEAGVDGTLQPPPQWPVLSPALPFPSGYHGHPWLQALEDTRGLPLRPETDARIPGGSAMVKHQSDCPLAAYLLHRLRLRFDPMPGPFVDQAYRGKVLHEALYQLFQEQAGRPGLPAHGAIAAAVERALQDRRARHYLARPALRAEQLRLQRLLGQWLDFESQRKGFVVAAVEDKRSMDVGGLALDIRLDRVDRLDDGRLLIIDYKSGNVSAAGWTRTRLAEPQLPLYAVLLDREKAGSVGGLALASVRVGACGMAGIVDDPAAACQGLRGTDNRRAVFGRSFNTWEDVFAHWRTGITALLEEIVAGQAANRLYQKEGLLYAGVDAVLRRFEGEAWLLAHGAEGMTAAEDGSDG